MKVKLLCLSGLAAAVAASASIAQTGGDLPPAWPRKGATLLVENDRGAAYNVVYPEGQTTPFHRHRYFFAGLDLNTSTIRVTQPDGTARNSAVVKNRMWYLPKGLTHSEMSVFAPGRHTVVIDIKDKAVPEAANTTDLPTNKYANSQTKVLDNDRVVIWDVVWAQGGEKLSSFNSRDMFLAIAEPGSIAIESPGRPPMIRRFKAGEAIFLPGGQVRTLSSAGGAPHAMLVEVK